MSVHKEHIINIVLFCIIVVLGYSTYKLYKQSKENVIAIERIKTDNDSSSFIYYEQKIGALEKINKELYDSIKIFKNEIDYLVQFKYKKNYNIESVNTDSVKSNVSKIDSVTNLYEYKDTSDTLSYALKIWSITKPIRYSLNFDISDKFTIVNKKYEDYNVLDIKSDVNGEIDDVTVLKKKEKTNIFDNFAIGPSIGIGYGVDNHNIEPYIGITITYDMKSLFKKK